MILYVGRNADILPRRLVEFFFKPNSLTFHRDPAGEEYWRKR